MLIEIIRHEVEETKQENTLFRANSMATKMFPKFAKIVGISYLFKTLARFVVELNYSNEKKGRESNTEDGRGFMTFEMEVDPLQMIDSIDEYDYETNVAELTLAAQKVFGAIRSSTDRVPPEFRLIMREIKDKVEERYGKDAVYKALGAFLFLRFYCPSFAVPHQFGLLPRNTPPNEPTQRQLLLLGKVLQTLANLTSAENKEEYMKHLAEFFEKNIPKMKAFYDTILAMSDATKQEAEDVTNIPVVPDSLKLNALTEIWGIIFARQKFMYKYFDDKMEFKEGQQARKLLDELTVSYRKAPKQLKKKVSKKANKPT